MRSYSATNAHMKKFRTGLVRLGFVTAVLTLASGCRDFGLDNSTARVLSDPEKNHAIHYSSETETLFVELPHDGRRLSHNQAADVRRFVERFKAESTSNINIAAPRNAGGRFAVARSMRQVEDIVSGAGIPREAIRLQDYSTRHRDFGPALRIAYNRPVALPPHCEDFSKDMGTDRERLPSRNFGCATQRNLALMVANARDLQHPQQESPRSSERRSVTWTQYVGGGSGSSESDGSGSPQPAAGPGNGPAQTN